MACYLLIAALNSPAGVRVFLKQVHYCELSIFTDSSSFFVENSCWFRKIKIKKSLGSESSILSIQVVKSEMREI